MMHTRVLILALTALAALSFVLARPAYHAQMLTQLHLEKSSTSLGAGCQYCHVRPQGGIGWNNFGNALDRRLEEDPELEDVVEALYGLLAARQDSDGDGYDDVLEVVAGTLPGNEQSKPSMSVAALETVLKGLGSVERFKAH